MLKHKTSHQGSPTGIGPWTDPFLIYINEIPETVRKSTCKHESHTIRENLFGKNCPVCGSVTSYADDSTYITAAKTRNEVQKSLDDNLENIKFFSMLTNYVSMSLKPV